MATCDYVQRFPRFPWGEITRPCILKNGHSGDHVVIEPRGNRRLAVMRNGQQPPSGEKISDYIAAHFPPKDYS